MGNMGEGISSQPWSEPLLNKPLPTVRHLRKSPMVSRASAARRRWGSQGWACDGKPLNWVVLGDTQ